MAAPPAVAAAKPVVTKVAPAAGRAAGGARVTVSGSEFTTKTTVAFGSTPGRSVKVASSTLLTVLAPAHAAGAVHVRVTSLHATSSANRHDVFTFRAVPEIALIAPASSSMAGGKSVVITGSNFVNVTKVTFGSIVGSRLHVVSSTRLTVMAPAHGAAAVHVRVVSRWGTSRAVTGDRFHYLTDTLSAGQTLHAGQSLVSANGVYRATMQSDGNFVVYKDMSSSLWSTRTGTRGSKITMQADGNLVVYAPGNHAVWSSGTAPSAGDHLAMQGDGNLVIWSKGDLPLWDYADGHGNTPDTLKAGQTLTAGQALWSTDGRFEAVMQADGNFVVYAPGRHAEWSTVTGAHGSTVTMQADGNLVVYAPGGTPTWSSGTAPSVSDRLVMQADGNLVIYSKGGLPLWDYGSGHSNNPDTLRAGQTLTSGQALWSTDGQYSAVMQADGNFVVYPPSGPAKWSTATGTPGSIITMQADGNLVINGPNGHAVWSSATEPSSGDRLVMQGDGNLVIYNGGGVAVWDFGSGRLGGGTGGGSGSAIVAAARSQVGYRASIYGSECNKFSAYWGSGTDCGNASRRIAWCADFAAWAWAQAGIIGLYGHGINANASSFRTWGQANGRWHPIGDGYTPQPGDVAEYSDAHVGIYSGGPATSPSVIDGNWWYPDTGTSQVYEQRSQPTNGAGARLSGYVSAP